VTDDVHSYQALLDGASSTIELQHEESQSYKEQDRGSLCSPRDAWFLEEAEGGKNHTLAFWNMQES
jgi:hypothetical protein